MSAPVAPATTPAAVPASTSAMRFVAVLAVSLAFTGALLRVADHVPGWLMGEPRAVRSYDSIDALERDLRTRLLLPAFFPETLEWPPARVLLSAGDGQPTRVEFRDTRTGRVRVVICQTIRHDAPIPPRLLPEGEITGRRRVDLSGVPAELSVARRGDQRWMDLSLVVQDRRVVVRAYPETDEAELIRLARSIHRGRP
jgi:hypothetical protein